MTAPKQVDFTVGTIVSDTFLDRLQEVSAAGSWNCVLKIVGTTVQVAASTGQDCAAVMIEGHMRYIEASATVSFTGADTAGSYGIWAVTGSDDNDPSWVLTKVSGASAPSGYAFARKLGTVSWSGTVLSALNQISGMTKHAHLHQIGAGDELPSNSIGTTQIADVNVTTAKIADANVTTAKIADANVTTAKIADANVTTAKIADANVTTAKIADSSVTTAKIANGSVTSAKLAGGVVSSTSIAAGAVTTTELADGSVTTVKLADSGVTTAKLATNAVTAAKVANTTLTRTQMASDVTDRLLPAGVVMPFAGAAVSLPTGWLLCYGQEIARASYPDLDAVIGTTYGAYTNGSGAVGTTHFKVPDLRGRGVSGLDNMGGTAQSRLTTGATGSPTWTNPSVTGGPTVLGSSAGVDKHSLSKAEMPAHTHTQNSHGHNISDPSHGHTASASSTLTVVYGSPGSTNQAPLYSTYTGVGTYPVSTSVSVNGNTTGITVVGNTATNNLTGGNNTVDGNVDAHQNVQPTMVMNYIIKY